MTGNHSASEVFEDLRPMLFSIAYRITGSVAESEDVVQDAWLRFEQVADTVESPKAFLSSVVTRLAIDVLRSARVRREEYVGEWFPEPLLADPYEDPARAAELADSVSMAALLRLERLSPLERAVFVLRDGQVQTIRTMLNPDKLGHVGPVADGWAVLREAYRVRRGD